MIQLITTHNELQEVLDAALQKAYSNLPVAEAGKVADEIIDGKELMKRLGISEPTLIRWRKKGKIPYIQLGATIRYRYQSVLEALEVKRKGDRK